MASAEQVRELAHGGRTMACVLMEGRYAGAIDEWTDLASVERTFERLGAIADRLAANQKTTSVAASTVTEFDDTSSCVTQHPASPPPRIR
jgi:hypothetical protein